MQYLDVFSCEKLYGDITLRCRSAAFMNSQEGFACFRKKGRGGRERAAEVKTFEESISGYVQTIFLG